MTVDDDAQLLTQPTPWRESRGKMPSTPEILDARVIALHFGYCRRRISDVAQPSNRRVLAHSR